MKNSKLQKFFHGRSHHFDILCLKILWCLVFGAWGFCATDAFAAKPLNILIITADDMNADSTGWMGSKLGATPDIDAFAATCHQFRNCHVSAPICQPSRSALMTGRVPHRNGALGFNPIRLDVPTMTEVMGSNGFFTAAINKTGHMMPRSKFNWDLILEGSGKNPKALREHLEQCIKVAAETGKPFFINANATDPHRPFAGNATAEGDEEALPRGKKAKKNQAAASPVKMFAESEVPVPSFLEDIPGVRKEVAQYFSSVRRLNESFRELLAALKAAGHWDDTVIVFLSDHGMSFPYSKATLYRNGTWSPVLLRWPGMGKPVVNTDMVSSVDIMPTVLDLCGVKKPDGLDGVSWLPIIRGEQKGPAHVFTHVNTVSSGKSFPGRCVRTATRAYIWNSWPDGKIQFHVEAMSGLSWAAMVEAAKQNPKIKPRVDHFSLRCAEEFYNEENDPDERRNLIDDPKYKTEIAAMKKLLLAHMEQTNDPLLGQFRGVKKNEEKESSAKSIEPSESTGSSAAVVVDENVSLAHTAQFFPLDAQGQIVGVGDVVKQTHQVFQRLNQALKLAQSDLSQAVKVDVYLAKDEDLPRVQNFFAHRYIGELKPAVSFVVGELAMPDALIAMDVVAAAADSKEGEVKWFPLRPKNGRSSASMLPPGPKIYISGMADTNALPEATRKTLEKLLGVLNHFGLKKTDVVQIKAFMQPISQVEVVRKEIVQFFGGQSPPIVFVDWISPPPNPPIEIELIASAKNGIGKTDESVSFITPPGTTSTKVYSRVARVDRGRMIYVSGLYGMKSKDAEGQVREIFAKLGDLMKKTGSDFTHLVKATYYVSDNDASNKLNDIRPEFYDPQRPPAASKAKVKGVGVAEKTVTLDMIAVTK